MQQITMYVSSKRGKQFLKRFLNIYTQQFDATTKNQVRDSGSYSSSFSCSDCKKKKYTGNTLQKH